MADKAKTLLQRLHLKPSTTLKVSKTAIFVLLGLISVQTLVGGLLWYAGRIKATAGSVSVVRSFPQGYGLNDVKGVTTDSSGNTYVAGSNLANGVTRSMWIRKLDSTGKLIKEWTHSSLSIYARLRIEHDASGNIYIVTLADPYGGPNGRVVKFNSEGDFQAQFDTPQLIRDIALDSNGYVYVSICNDHIQKYTMAGALQADWTVGGGSYACGDITIDSTNNLYASDSLNHVVKKYDLNATLDGTPVATIGGYGSGPGQFGSIEGLATDSNNYLYVGDTYNNRVEIFNTSGGFDSQWTLPVGTGANNFVGGGQYTGFEGVARLADISISANNRVLLADWYGAKVLEYNTAGAQTSQFGLYVPGNLGLIGGLAVATDGSLYTFDAAASRVQKFDSSGNFLLQWGSRGTGAGQFNNDFEGHKIAVDSSGYVYVGDTGVDNIPRIQKFNSSGVIQAQWDVNWSGECGSGPVSGLAVGPNGHIYTVDGCNKIQEFTNIGGHLDSFGSEVTYDSHGMGFDASGNIYVVDGSTVKKYRADKSLETSWSIGARGDDIAVSPQGEVYVGMVFITGGGASPMVKKYDTNGVYSTAFSSSDATGSIGGYVALDTAGKLYLGSYSGGLSSYGTYGSWLSLVSDDTSLTMDSITLPGGIADFDYQTSNGVVTIPNSGRQGVAAFSVTAGALPAGMSINATTAQLSGTPTQAGAFTFTVTGQDAVSSASREYQLTIQDHVRITTASLANGREGVAYSQTIQKTSGFPNYGQTYTYSLTAGSLPAGLSLSASSGAITGTPTAVGSSSLTLRVAESFGGSPIFYDSKQLSINVSPSHQVTTLPASSVTETTATLNGATNYPDEITARGFQYGLDTNYGTQVADNTANPGYKVAASTEITASSDLQLSGGNGMTIDADGNRYLVDTSNNRILKYSKSGVLQATWGSIGSGDGEFDRPTDIAIGPSGKFYVVDDNNNRVQVLSPYGGYEGQFALLPGIHMAIAVDSSENIYVSGRETIGAWWWGDYRPYVRKYSYSPSGATLLLDWGADGDGDYQFHGYPYDLAIDGNNDLYVVDIGNNRVLKFDDAGQLILKIGGTGPDYNGSGSTDGQFSTPTSVALDDNNNVFVVDNGRIQKFNSNGGFAVSWNYDQSDNNSYAPYSLVSGDAGSIITASWDTSGTGSWAQPQFITYSSGIEKTVSGLSCSTTYHYRAYATNTSGTKYGSDATFTTDACPDTPINITNTTLLNGTQGSYYQDLVNVEYATGSVAYYLASGALPDGLSLDSSTGYITGTPLYGGDYNFSILVQDSNSTDTQSFSLSVSDQNVTSPPIEITTQALPDAVLQNNSYTSYQENIYTQNGVYDVQFSVTAGSLPPGLSIVSYNWYAVVYGTPTTPGTYTFTIQAQDARVGDPDGADTREYTIVVPEPTYPSIYIETNNLSDGMVGFHYDAGIYYQNAQTQPVFSLVSGSLPPGISLSLEGYLQGTPTQEGTYTFTVQADDGYSTDTQELTLTIIPAPPPAVNTPFVSITSPSGGSTFTGGASTITGTGPANQTITLFVDNQQIGTTTANSDGVWSYNATGITEGSHTLDAKWVPGAEVMFVPYLDMQNLRTNVRVYDTSTDQLIKEIGLPFYSFAFQAIVSPGKDKLLLTGGLEATGEGAVWEVDLNTSLITAYPSGGYPVITSAVLSPDGTKLYTNSGSNVVKIFNVGQGFADSSLSLSGSGYDAPALLKISEDGSELYAMVFDSNEHTPAPFTIKVIHPTDLTVQRSIDVTSVSDPDRREWAAGFGVAGNVAYVPHSIKDADLTGISTLRLYDLTTGSLLKSIDISPLSTESGYAGMGNVYIDAPNHLAYLPAKDINLPGYSYILRVDLNTDNVQATQLTSGQGGGGLPFLRGLAAAPSVNKVYLSPWLNGLPTEGVEVYNTNTRSALSGTGYPILNPANSFAYALGSNFIGPIAPPKDSIAFSVPAERPTCEQQGNCPQTCEQRNTCPQPCEVTNTCPKPCSASGGTCPQDCTTTNTCPTVTPTTPPTTPVAPKIVSTQFPTPGATPSTSRLGWLDRTALAVARFVPQQAAIGFPYVLFVLLLCFALSLYYQSSNEIRKDKLNRDFLAKRKSIRAQQDNFIALASHYLNTPITIIQGGVELEEGKRR